MITKCAVTVLAGLALTACHRPAADTSKVGAPPPARTVVREGDLNTILLTPDAESRLGIETKPVELHDAARMHVLPAVVMLPPDARTTLTAPFTGRVQFSKQTPPKPGSTSEAATLLATIIPVASPDVRTGLVNSREAMRGTLTRASEDEAAARIALARAERLLRDHVGSQRAVDDANAALAVARATRESAERELTAIEGSLSANGDEGPSIELAQPPSMTLLQVLVTDGQFVQSGMPLFVLQANGRRWIRVDVPVFLAPKLRADVDVHYGQVASRSQDDARLARPVAMPREGTPLTWSVARFYETDDANLGIGERCSVTIPELGAGAERLGVPAEAVLYDASGGTWVYLRAGQHEYRRERVDIEFTREDIAYCAHGPARGTEVVTAGAAELFGFEFGVGK